MFRLPKVATPLVAATEVVPVAKLPEDRATWMVSFEPVVPVVIVLPNWSSIVTPTATVPPAVMVPAGWVVTTSLFSAAGFTVKELEAVEVTDPVVESEAVMVYVPAALIWRPLKFATPLDAVTVVVPPAKLPEDRATWMVSFEPVVPVVIVLPNWSSIVTPTETVPPAATGLAGCVVTVSLFSADGLT